MKLERVVAAGFPWCDNGLHLAKDLWRIELDDTSVDLCDACLAELRRLLEEVGDG